MSIALVGWRPQPKRKDSTPMKKTGKKLSMNRETLRTLSPDEIKRAAGGEYSWDYVSCGNGCSHSVYLPCPGTTIHYLQ
jgi:hypothetical protein